MKTLKTDQVLLTLTGEEIAEGDTKVTVGLIITNALSQQTTNPHRAYQLAKQIATNKKVELKAEDIVFIKEMLLQSQLVALYIGQVIEILESKD